MAISQSTLSINAVDSGGNVHHMYVTIYQNKVVKKTGYTPLTFTGTVGKTYTVSISNYQNIVFSHWENGATTKTRTLTMPSSTQSWTAYYNVLTTTSSTTSQTVAAISDYLSSTSVVVGQSFTVGGTVFDTSSNGMAGVNLVATMGTFSASTTSGQGGAFSMVIPTSAVGTFVVNVKTSAGTVSAAPLALTVSSSPVTSTTSVKTGIDIPLYSISTLSTFLADMRSYGPSLPYVITINPNSGPGSTVDSRFTSAIATMRNSGLDITIIGYVPTGYGTSRTVANVEGMIDTWYSLYPNIDGLMFDEVDNTASTDSFYKTITDYARSHGAHFIRGNPGAPIDSGKVSMFDMIAVGESSSYPSTSALQSDAFNGAYSKSKFAFTIHDQPTLDTTWIAMAKQYIGYVYITDDVEPNPYDTVPSYFIPELQALQAN